MKKFAISIFLLLTIFTACVKKNSNESDLMTEFRKNAEKDIKEDNVKIFGLGFPLPPKTEKDVEKQNQIEKVWKKYGLHKKNLGCTISDELTKAYEEYEKVTDVYLEKRNGKGWKLEMKTQIDSINKNYR